MSSFSVDLDKLREKVRASRNSSKQQPAASAASGSGQANKIPSTAERGQGTRDRESKVDAKTSYDDFVTSVLNRKPSPGKGSSAKLSTTDDDRPDYGLHREQHLRVHGQHIPQGNTLLRSAVKPRHGISHYELQRYKEEAIARERRSEARKHAAIVVTRAVRRWLRSFDMASARDAGRTTVAQQHVKSPPQRQPPRLAWGVTVDTGVACDAEERAPLSHCFAADERPLPVRQDMSAARVLTMQAYDDEDHGQPHKPWREDESNQNTWVGTDATDIEGRGSVYAKDRVLSVRHARMSHRETMICEEEDGNGSGTSISGQLDSRSSPKQLQYTRHASANAAVAAAVAASGGGGGGGGGGDGGGGGGGDGGGEWRGEIEGKEENKEKEKYAAAAAESYSVPKIVEWDAPIPKIEVAATSTMGKTTKAVDFGFVSEAMVRLPDDGRELLLASLQGYAVRRRLRCLTVQGIIDTIREERRVAKEMEDDVSRGMASPADKVVLEQIRMSLRLECEKLSSMMLDPSPPKSSGGAGLGKRGGGRDAAGSKTFLKRGQGRIGATHAVTRVGSNNDEQNTAGDHPKRKMSDSASVVVSAKTTSADESIESGKDTASRVAQAAVHPKKVWAAKSHSFQSKDKGDLMADWQAMDMELPSYAKLASTPAKTPKPFLKRKTQAVKVLKAGGNMDWSTVAPRVQTRQRDKQVQGKDQGQGQEGQGQGQGSGSGARPSTAQHYHALSQSSSSAASSQTGLVNDQDDAQWQSAAGRQEERDAQEEDLEWQRLKGSLPRRYSRGVELPDVSSLGDDRGDGSGWGDDTRSSISLSSIPSPSKSTLNTASASHSPVKGASNSTFESSPEESVGSTKFSLSPDAGVHQYEDTSPQATRHRLSNIPPPPSSRIKECSLVESPSSKSNIPPPPSSSIRDMTSLGYSLVESPSSTPKSVESLPIISPPSYSPVSASSPVTPPPTSSGFDGDVWGNSGAAQGLDQGAHALDALDAPSRDKDGMSPNVMEHVAAGVEREEGVSIDDLEYLLEQLHTEAPYMRDEAFPHRQIGPIPRLFVESAFFTRLTDRERDDAVRNASRRLAAIRLAGKFSELPRGQYPTFDGHKPSG